MLEVITPAETKDLTVLATVKAELGITDRANDGALVAYIKQASDVVAKFCNRAFAYETVRESFRLKRPADELVLRRLPVGTVVSVVENDVTLSAVDYEVDSENAVLVRLRDSDPAFWSGGKITVVYTSGYKLPDELPSGIERAAILLVKQFASSGDRDLMVRSETVEGAGQTDYFSLGASGLPPEVEGLLTPHRKPCIG